MSTKWELDAAREPVRVPYGPCWSTQQTLLEYYTGFAGVLDGNSLEYPTGRRQSTLRIALEYPTDLAGVPNMNHTVAIKVCWISGSIVHETEGRRVVLVDSAGR